MTEAATIDMPNPDLAHERRSLAGGRRLSPRQEVFVWIYASEGVGVRAAKAAGYRCGTSGSARAVASRLLTFANVQRRLAEVRTTLEQGTIAERTERLALLSDLLRGLAAPGGEAPTVAQRLRAARLMGLALGDFLTKAPQRPTTTGYCVPMPARAASAEQWAADVAAERAMAAP